MAHNDHPSNGPGVNYSRPAQYDGPSVSTQAANVNPSAEGANTATGGGVNPQGADAHPGQPGPERPNAPYPDTTVNRKNH